MSSGELALEIRELTKRYPLHRSLGSRLRGRAGSEALLALDRVSLAVRRGDVLGLLGANGAGKTTLIHILCTLLAPSSGEVRVAGHDLEREAAQVRRQVGLVTSNERSFYWRLSGRQNLRFFAELFRVPAPEIEPRIDEFLSALEIAEYADRRFDGYSTGIRQRFAFARALLHEPRILFMDEPTRGLDPGASLALLQFIRERVLARWRPTVVLTSHNLTEIEALCDSVAILDRGRLLRCGALVDLLRSAGAQRAYRVEVAGADRKLADGLARLLGADRVRPLERGALLALELRVGEDDAALSSALRHILDQGAAIRRCEPVQLSLADVFRETVRRRSAA